MRRPVKAQLLERLWQLLPQQVQAMSEEEGLALPHLECCDLPEVNWPAGSDVLLQFLQVRLQVPWSNLVLLLYQE